MKQTNILRNILIGLGVVLFSLPAAAQLSLSAGAKAKADSKDGATATAGADGDADGGSVAAEDAELSEPEATAETTEPVAPPPPPPMVAGPEPEPADAMIEADKPDTSGIAGYDGGFFIKTNDGNFKLKINGRVHTRWNFANDEFNVTDSDGDPGTNHTMHSSFQLPYARIILSGNVFDPRLKYCLYWDISTNTLIYGWADWAFIPQKLVLRVGKFKRPISRYYLTSSAKRAFIRGPLGDMGAGLDTGIELNNDFEKAKGLEWAISVTNGSMGTNGDFSPVVAGRIGYNNGIKGYDDTDFVGGPLRFGIALSASTEFNHDGNDNAATHQTVHYVSLDGMIKVNGLTLSAAGTMQSQALEYFWDFDENDEGPQSGMAYIGSYIQGGYFFAEHFEPTLRYGFLHDTRVDDDLAEEITAGFNFHFFGNHAFKLENNISLFMNRGPDAIDDETITLRDILFSTQLELNF